MNAPTPDTTSQISIFDVNFNSAYLNVLLQGNKWGGPLGSAATVYYSFPTSRNDAYWSQDFINGYGIFDPTTDGTPDYVSLTPLTSSQQNGITLALNAWANVANLDFIKVNETPDAVGDIRFGFTQDGAMAPDIYAYSYNVDPSLYDYSDIFPYTRGGDIWFNKNQPDQTGNNFSTGAMGYFVGLHEIGHSLGLDHSFSEEDGDLGLPTNIEYVQYTVMSYSDLPGSHFDGFNEYYPTTPMLYDILAIQHLYGANNSYNADDTVYEFSSSQRYYQTLWDAGGNDTIKYASSIGGVINLEAGSFSQLGKAFKVGVNNNTVQKDNIAIAFNVVIENAIGGSGSDRITGNSADNRLEGAAGDDTLDGGMGADILIGGKGNDTYIVDNINDVITELANEGTDLVKTSVTYTLSAHVENLTLTGTEGIDGIGNNINNIITGNDANNTLNGNDGADTLNGAAGDDILDGGAGVDKLIGGNDNDTYIVDLVRTGTAPANYKVALQDTITETAVAGSGTDTVILRGDSIDSTTFTTLTLDANIENLDASNTGSTKLNLTGNALANTLIGNAADNTLDGGIGSDSLIGGIGNDIYVLDLKTTVVSGISTLVFDDSITELDGSNEGIDTVKLRGTATFLSDATLTLDNQWANIEILDASATGSTKLNLRGNDFGNTLIGNAAANTLTGGTGNDTLNGGAGADTMIGGDGNDTYVVDHVGDSITELADNVSSQTYQTQYSSNNTGISADGRFVVFDSYSEFNFGNNVLAYDVFVKDMQTGVLIKANDYSEAFAHSISPDGKFVLYLSYTDNANHDRGLYLKNLETGENTLISTSSSGELGNSDAINDNARFSADGKFISFSSYASNLTPDDTDHRSDIFVKNLITGTTTLVSTNSNGVKDNGGAVVSTISANGRYLTFHSTATNLAAADTNASIDVYWKDTLTNETKLVSSSASGAVGNNRSWYASISTDGNLVAFESSATNLLPTNDNAYVDIFVKNMTTGAIQRVSTSATGIEGNGNSENASISADGRYVLFESRASNLVANDTNGASDIFIKDLQTSAIQRVSTSSSNQQVSGESFNARFSANGKFVIFDSTSNNLVSGDNNPAVLDTFIKNIETGEVRLVSVQTQTTILNSGGTDLVNASISYTLSDHVENLTLTGTAAINGTGNDLDNVITGNAGNNILDGKGGTDTLIGGKGNDTYILDGENDEVVESLDEGIDLVKASVNYTLTNHVENLTLTGVDAINGTGNSINNTITGNDANNTLNGADGNDSLIGGAGEDMLDGGNGVDKLAGGIGNDTYVVDLVQTGSSVANFRVALQDTITEAGTPGSGNDTVQLRGHYDHLNTTTLTISANLENLDASLTVDTKLNLTGNILANTLTGNDANNILDGGAGIDTLIGGLGNDTYVLDLKTTLVNGVFTAVFDDTITEFNGSNEGIDTVKLRGNATLSSTIDVSLNRWTNIENIDASATGTTKLTLKGNDEDNTLIGNNAANILEGGLGNDTLNGGAGADRMIGGKGWDTYYVDNIGDVIIEQVNSDTFLADEGVDTILSSISLSLANYANVEYLTLLGTAHLNATGNAGSNLLIGNSGNNILDGGGNRDDMQGGAGNDTYIVDDINDQAIETIAGAAGGIDIVLSSVSFALNYNVENLTLTGTENIDGYGNELNNIIRGNAGNNRLSGGWDGSDTLIGGAGNDIYEVTYLFASAAKPVTQDTVIESLNAGIDSIILSAAGNNGLMNKYLMPLNVENLDANNTYGAFSHFIGNSLANYIIGNDYSHTFDGGAGVDTLVGGNSSDTYIVDLITNINAGATAASLQDIIIEDASGDGSDTIQLRGNVKLTTATTLTLNGGLANVENLDASLTSSSKLNLTGNDANNVLTGNAAANTLTGGLGDDTLNGGTGADTMIGGDGDDTYVVDNIADQVIENDGEGVDWVKTSVSYTLSNYVEFLELTGTSAINGTGNGLDNIITGNAGNNILDGGAGADTLIGGKGNDTYIVDDEDDEIIENLNEGTDLVKASVSYTLSDNVENLTLTDGSANGGTAALNGTGNALANTITGNAGNNILDGGAGVDKLIGGNGDDTYIVDNPLDVVIELTNKYSNTTQAENGDSDNARFSSDGKFVIFSSTATNLLPDNTDLLQIREVFLKNLQTGEIQSITNNAQGKQANGNADAILSSNGEFSLITSSASNLVANDRNNLQDVFLKNLITGETKLISTNASGDQANKASSGMDISADGRYVLLKSFASNLVSNGWSHSGVYIKDTQTGVVEKLVTGNHAIGTAAFSPNGDYVIFESSEASLTGDYAGSRNQILIKNLQTGTVEVVTKDNNGEFYNAGSGRAFFSPDGNSIIFSSAATNIVPVSNGRFGYSVSQVFVKNLLTGEVQLVSTNANGIQGDDASISYGFSPDGAHVLISSYANNLIPDSANLYSNDIFLKNIVTGEIQRITSDAEGNAGDYLVNNNSRNPSFSADGRYVIFSSSSTNLVPNDTNFSDDVFIKDTLTGEIQRISTPQTNYGGGIDEVKASISYTLGANLENLTLTGTAINGTGNNLNNVITGNSSNNTLSGGAGNDTLYGGAGNDLLAGGTGNDSLNGGADNDTLIGGIGNDILIGGTGADTFVWALADKGSNGKPAIDKIADFSSTEDKLDLRDLLIGESSGNILNYLDITTSVTAGVTNTELRISNTGGFIGGNYSSATENQHITLIGLNLLAGTNEADLIASLISQNKLIINA